MRPKLICISKRSPLSVQLDFQCIYDGSEKDNGNRHTNEQAYISPVYRYLNIFGFPTTLRLTV